jgi:hypothetical protein
LNCCYVMSSRLRNGRNVTVKTSCPVTGCIISCAQI